MASRRYALEFGGSGHRAIWHTEILIAASKGVLEGESPERTSALSLVPFTLRGLPRLQRSLTVVLIASRQLRYVPPVVTRPCIVSVEKRRVLLNPAGEHLAYLDPRTYIRGRATLLTGLLF